MAIFKCKMCGGSLEITGESVATCEYCGTEQTLPKLDDDKRAGLYDRALQRGMGKERMDPLSCAHQRRREEGAHSGVQGYGSIRFAR